MRNNITNNSKIGIILGSGLGDLANRLEQPTRIKYGSIPDFPTSTVEGHAGQIVSGSLQGVPVFVMQGRFHYYEGYALQDVTFPVRVMSELGISDLIVTNAAGGICEDFEPGDLMAITDHLNLIGNNPLIGPNVREWGPRFPDMSNAYSRELLEIARNSARSLGIRLQEGVYASLSGPTYETPAEIRMLRKLGADAVGMSTVPEVLVARHMGMRVLGLSCITNMAAGITNDPLTHDEVVQTSEKAKSRFTALIESVLENMLSE